MGKNLFLVSAVLLFISVTNSSAQFNIRYIMSDEILYRYQAAKAAEEKLTLELTKIQQEVTKRENELINLKDQLEKQGTALRADRKKNLVDSLQQKYIQYQQFVKQKQDEAISRRAELFKPISDTVTSLVGKIAKEENCDIVFDGRAGGIVYASPKHDLSDKVIGIISPPIQGAKTIKSDIKKHK
jgi:Skp family chaperone for outer membrane proteins